MNFSFNLIIIPVVILATAIMGSRYVKQGLLDDWYKQLRKPDWTPKGSLIGSIWTFIYAVTGLAVMWFWNVPIFTWFHYIVGAILLYNAYLNATWNRTFFIEHNIENALNQMKKLNLTTIVATVIMAWFSPIGAVLMLPYIIWVYIATKLTKEILDLNKN